MPRHPNRLLPTDDPRHGTTAGRNQGCVCGSCRRAWARKCKAYRLRKTNGQVVMVDATDLVPLVRDLLETHTLTAAEATTGVGRASLRRILSGESKRVHKTTADRIRAASGYLGKHWVSSKGTRRRLQALAALGWSTAQIAAECGMWHRALRAIQLGQTEWIRGTTAAAVSEAYERLSMRLPSTDTRTQRSAVSRTRNTATRLGWVPPLAWDDIDNDPKPANSKARSNWPTEELVAEWDHLRQLGATKEDVAQRLGITTAAIDQAVHRSRNEAA